MRRKTQITKEIMTSVMNDLQNGMEQIRTAQRHKISPVSVTRIKNVMEGGSGSGVTKNLQKMASELLESAPEPDPKARGADTLGLSAALAKAEETAQRLKASIEKFDQRMLELDDLSIEIEKRTKMVLNQL